VLSWHDKDGIVRKAVAFLMFASLCWVILASTSLGESRDSIVQSRICVGIVAENDTEHRTCIVYDRFREYLDASRRDADVLRFFSSRFKDSELNDILTSADDVTIQNKNASIALFNFVEYFVRTGRIISHEERCDSSHCQLSVVFKMLSNKSELLLLDYVKSCVDGDLLIDKIVIDSREESRRPAPTFDISQSPAVHRSQGSQKPGVRSCIHRSKGSSQKQGVTISPPLSKKARGQVLY